MATDQPISEEGEIDEDTYNEHFMVTNVDKIIEHIKDLFKQDYIYHKSTLKKRLKMHHPYPDIQINTALTELLKYNYMEDMFGRSGELKNIGNYYMFMPMDEKADDASLRSSLINYPNNNYREITYDNIPTEIITRKSLVAYNTLTEYLNEILSKERIEKYFPFYKTLKKGKSVKKSYTASKMNERDKLIRFYLAITKLSMYFKKQTPRLEQSTFEKVFIVLSIKNMIERVSFEEKVDLLRRITPDELIGMKDELRDMPPNNITSLVQLLFSDTDVEAIMKRIITYYFSFFFFHDPETKGSILFLLNFLVDYKYQPIVWYGRDSQWKKWGELTTAENIGEEEIGGYTILRDKYFGLFINAIAKDNKRINSHVGFMDAAQYNKKIKSDEIVYKYKELMSKTKRSQKAKNPGKRLINLSISTLIKIVRNQGIEIDDLIPVACKNEEKQSRRNCNVYHLFDGIADDTIVETLNYQYSNFHIEVVKASIELLYSYFDLIQLRGKRWHFNAIESIFLDLKNK